MFTNPSCRDLFPTLQFPDCTLRCSTCSWNTRTSHRRSLQNRIGCHYRRGRPIAGFGFATIDVFHVTRLKTLGGITRLLPSLCVPGLHHPNGREVASRWSTTDRRDLIRKIKIIAFALGALGNSTDVDYSNPWNSCGDGYQTTAGSSSRSGSTLNAYE
jgi:hypothetical protein